MRLLQTESAVAFAPVFTVVTMLQHQRKTSDTVGQRVCSELNNLHPSMHHPVDVCLLFHFTEKGKHLEVIFPLAFHLFHHLPL